MDNDIDAQIRDILMKSTPINDNSPLNRSRHRCQLRLILE